MYDDLIKQLTATGNYKIIKRLEPVTHYHAANDTTKKIGIYLDTEATGMELDIDKIIELAMVPFEFDEAGNIYRILPAYTEFQDPHMPISEFITSITGITDEMVKGKSINWEAVTTLLDSAELVIAHNARFDRPFLEKKLDKFKEVNWGCSLADVDWNVEGFEGVKLEYLAYKYGFFYEGHRAQVDCMAGIEILSRVLPKSGVPVLKRLLDNARRTDVRLWAEGAPFNMKDILKKRGYRWSPGEEGKRKAWYFDLPEEKLADEMRFLNESVYSKPVWILPMDRYDAKVRYSKRV